MSARDPKALEGRAVLSLTGEETISFLHNLLTADLNRLKPGEVTHSALLTPQGKILQAFFVFRTEDGVLIDAAPDQGTALSQRLGLYKLRAKVHIEDRTGALSVLVSEDGPEDAPSDPRHPAMGRRWIEPGEHDLDDGAYDARRIALGVPEFAYDYADGAVFPMDVNLDALRAVDYKKGCFVGQEVASRMYRKGEVRKRSWRVAADGLIEKGMAVTADGSTLGEITSARGQEGIALLRVDRVEAAKVRPEAGGVPLTLGAPDYL